MAGVFEEVFPVGKWSFGQKPMVRIFRHTEKIQARLFMCLNAYDVRRACHGRTAA